MGRQVNSNCQIMPPTFFEMLASCIMKDSENNIFLNVACYTGDCDDFSSAIECGENIDNPEAYIVANAFTTDACGNPAIKLRVCGTEEALNEEGGELQ